MDESIKYMSKTFSGFYTKYQEQDKRNFLILDPAT